MPAGAASAVPDPPAHRERRKPLAVRGIVAPVMADETVVAEHLNRDRAASQATRLLVIVLLLASAGVVTIVSIGGCPPSRAPRRPRSPSSSSTWCSRSSSCAGAARPAHDRRLAIILGIFAAVAAPGWFDRAKDGFTDPALSSDVLGLLCTLLVPLQLADHRRHAGFRQAWNVEVERTRAEPARRSRTMCSLRPGGGMADSGVSKTPADGRAGSNPAPGSESERHLRVRGAGGAGLRDGLLGRAERPEPAAERAGAPAARPPVPITVSVPRSGWRERRGKRNARMNRMMQSAMTPPMSMP